VICYDGATPKAFRPTAYGYRELPAEFGRERLDGGAPSDGQARNVISKFGYRSDAWEKLPVLRRCYVRPLSPDGDVEHVWQGHFEAALEARDTAHQIFSLTERLGTLFARASRRCERLGFGETQLRRATAHS
jgi:hypothetical protein